MVSTNSFGNVVVQSKLFVNSGGSFLEDSKGSDDGFGHHFTGTSNVKVLQRTLCLRPPVAIRWNLEITEGIRLSAERLHRDEDWDGDGDGDG